jgi:carbon monoxide dehydrogenase subunit G
MMRATMPFVAKGSRHVSVTPEVAFDRLADYASWADWMPQSFRPTGSPSGALVIGRKIRVRVGGLPGVTTIEVSEARRPAEIAWQGGLPGVLFADHRFLFEADGDGTKVTSLETWSGALASLARLFIQPMAERIGGQQLEALARAVGS